MTSQARLANGAWESLLRAHATLMKGFAEDPVWADVTMREYDVLYTLAKRGEPISLTELNRHVLLSQPAMSRMVERLEGRGLIDRDRNPADGRGVRLSLSAAGAELQHRVGRRHALAVAEAVGSRLSRDEMETLERLCSALSEPTEVMA